MPNDNDHTAPTAELPIARDALSDAARIIQGGNARASWRVSGDNLQQNLRHCTPAKKELVIWAFQFCISNAIFLDDFAAQVGYDPKTIDKIITGTYRNPRTSDLYDIPDQLALSIDKFRKSKISATQIGDMKFIMTPSARKIEVLCDLCRESHTPGFLFGASHIGKTWGLEHYSVHNNHGATPMVTVPSNSGLGGLVRAIADRVGVTTKGNTADTISRIKGAITPDMLVIFDEIHRLTYTYRKEAFFASLEAIRDIYDFTKCGMILSTTNFHGDEIAKERKRYLEQLFRRGVHRRQLGNIVRKEDLVPILTEYGLDWPDKKLAFEFNGIPVPQKPYDIMRGLATDSGLKAICERIRYGRKLAKKDREQLSWKYWVQADLTIAGAATEPSDDWN